jgi:ATP-dependent RNA helicase DOB1
MSNIRIFIAPDLRGKDARMSVLKSVKEVKRRFPDGIPQLDPRDDMKIDASKLTDVVQKIETMERRLYGHALHDGAETLALMQLYQHKMALTEQHTVLRKEIKAAKSVLQLDELKHMKRVLRRLEFSTADDVVTLKGRVACEISSGDSLVLTEMIFNGVFNDLDVNQVVALVTCFVFDEKSKDAPPPAEAMAESLRALQDTARRVAKVSIECKIELNEEDYVESFRIELMAIAFAWSNGAKFHEIMQLTEVYEGSIIRVMRRLEELLRQLCAAAKTIGNTELENKFASGITKIKRDIIFASSLYL